MWDRRSMARAVLGQPYELPAQRTYADEMVLRLDAGGRTEPAAARDIQRRTADEWLAAIAQLSLYGMRRQREGIRARRS